MDIKLSEQQGIVLITVLIFLLILSLLTLTMLSSSQLELRMSTNGAEEQVVFQAAEAGLTMTENQLNKHNFIACILNIQNVKIANQFNLMASNKIICDTAKQYQLALYQITSKAMARDHYSITLQSIYAIPFKSCDVQPMVIMKKGRLSWVELFN